ncbi:MAG: ATP-binding protein [Sulfuritalea sp.]|nr:ATP-binding protein [Sulfuritalea sp.]MDP1982881.1 ATP-binding protein [Sulfuritalea sp.]
MSIPDTAAILRLLDALEQKAADDLESQFLDFKPWQGPKEDLRVACEYAACFANASGGVVVFGVADKQRGRAQAIHGAAGYDLDVFRKGICAGTSPGIDADVFEIDVTEDPLGRARQSWRIAGGWGKVAADTIRRNDHASHRIRSGRTATCDLASCQRPDSRRTIGARVALDG